MKPIKALCCGSCRGQTTHNIIHQHDETGNTADGDIQWWETFSIIQCAGCQSISFRKTSSCTEDIDPFSGQLEESVEQYPDPIGKRPLMDGHEHFPAKTLRAYRETIKSLNHSLPLLAAIGLRAVIESICLEQSVQGKDLQVRINQLASQGLLSQKQADFLHNHRFMGNIAAHEIESPKPEHLVAALDIAETLLKTIYILPHLAHEISSKT